MFTPIILVCVLLPNLVIRTSGGHLIPSESTTPATRSTSGTQSTPLNNDGKLTNIPSYLTPIAKTDEILESSFSYEASNGKEDKVNNENVESDRNGSERIENQTTNVIVGIVSRSEKSPNTIQSERKSTDLSSKKPASNSITSRRNFKRKAVHPLIKSKQESEKMVAAMTDSLTKILNLNGDSKGKSGSTPRSGPSAAPFGSVDDLPPIVFPHPATHGRESFVSLPSLDREKVSKHFKEKDLQENANHLVNDFHFDEDNFLATTPSPKLIIRERTPKPNTEPIEMMLKPQPLGRDGKRLLSRPQHSQHFYHQFHHQPEREGIEIEVKGDSGQIKRILSQEDMDDQHEFQVHHFYQPVTPAPFGSTLYPYPHGLDPLLLNNNVLFDHFGNPPQRRFSDFSVTPDTNYIFPVTVSPDTRGTIFHGPNLPSSQLINTLNAANGFSDDRRRPLTREHFLLHNSNPHNPRGLDDRVHFGLDLHSHQQPSEPHVITQYTDSFIPQPNSQSVFIREDSAPSNLIPLSPRLIGDGISNYPLGSFGANDYVTTPSPVHYVTTPSPLIHKTTPRPNFEIQTATTPRTPAAASQYNPIHLTGVDHHPLGTNTYLPFANPPASHSIAATTFRPHIAPHIGTTPAPPRIVYNTPRPTFAPIITPRPTFPHIITPRPHTPNRGTSKFQPPSHTRPAFIAPGPDFSSQYQSGEHLDLYRPKHHWSSALSSAEDSSEYSYQYAVYSPSTGDVKRAHQSKLPHGGVVGGYSLLQPDGITRRVSYTADGHSGFQADVQYLTPEGRVVATPPGK